MGVNLGFCAVETYYRRVDGTAGRVSIVFSPEQARDCMRDDPLQPPLLCVDIPRALLCGSLSQAYAFFREGGHAC